MTAPDILNNNDAPFPGFPVFGQSPSLPNRRLDEPALHPVADSRERAARRLAVVAAGLLHQRGTPHNIYVRGPLFTRFDFSFRKRFPFGRGASFDLQFDLLNALDNVNFNTTFDPGGRIGQIVWRLNW